MMTANFFLKITFYFMYSLVCGLNNDYISMKPLFTKDCNKEMVPDIATCIKLSIGNKINMDYIWHIPA